MAARNGDKKQGSSSHQEQSAPGVKEHLPYKNVYSSSNTVVVSNNGRVTHSNPGIAAVQRSNTALSLSPQFSMFTEHNLPLPVNNTTDVSDIWQNWHQNESVDVLQLLSAMGDSFDLPNEASDTHGRQKQRLRGKIASYRSNAGSTIACDSCSSMGTSGILEHVTGGCEHYGSVAGGGEHIGGMAGGGDPCGGVTSGGKPYRGMADRSEPGGGHPYGRGEPYGGVPGRNDPYGGMPGRRNPCGGMPGRSNPYGGMAGRSNPRQGMAGGGDLHSAVASRGQLYGDGADWSKPYEGMFGGHDPYEGMADGGNPYGGMAGGNDPLGGVACESEPLAGGGAPYGGVAGGSEPYGGVAGGGDTHGPYGGMAGRSMPYDGVGGGGAPCEGLNELYNGLPPTAASSGLQDSFSRDMFDGIPYDENFTGGSRNKYSPTECINGPMYSNPLLSQACRPAESISNIRTKGELAQKKSEEAYQQYFTSLPSYSKIGDILDLGSGYDQELSTPTPQLTPDQSSTSQAGLTSIAVTAGNYSSSMTNTVPVVTGHTEQQGSNEGGELVTILSSGLDPKFGPNHVEDDDAWDMDYGVSDGEADVPWDIYLNSPGTVQSLDQNRLHRQEISAMIGGISANVAHPSGSDLLDPVSCSDHGTEIGGASIGGSHGNTSSDSTSTLPELPSALAQSSSSQTRHDNTVVSCLSGGNTFHSTENHHLESQGGECFCHYPVSAQPGQVRKEALSQRHSKPSNAIEDSFEMMKTMKKGSQSVHHCLNTQSHVPAAFRDSRRDGASSEPFKPLVLTSTEDDQKGAPLLEDPDLASICDQVSSLPLPTSEPSTTPSPANLGNTPPEDAGRQNEAIDNTVTPNKCSPAVSLVTTSNATVDVTRDITNHSQVSSLQPSMATQGLCEKTELFQTQTYSSKEEQITDITVRRDISGSQRDCACEIVRRMSESYQMCKECLSQQQTLNLNIAITTSARLCRIDFDFQRMRMRIHLPIQCVGLVEWLQEQNPTILDRQRVVQQTFVLLAIFHGLGKLSLWGSFTVCVDGRDNQAYVKIEILKMLCRMQQQVMCEGLYDPCIDDVKALQLLFMMAMQPALSPPAMPSPDLRSRFLTIVQLMSHPSCVFHVADMCRYFGERRFCQLQVEVEGKAISVFCMEKESLSEAVKDIQSMLPKCWTWQLRLVANNSIVTEEVARADCPVIHLKFVPILDEYIKS